MSMTSGPPILDVTDLRKTYRLGRVDVPVLKGVDLAVREGEWVAVLGASGSGKSTMLHLIGGLDRPDRSRDGPASSIRYRGRDLAGMSKGDLDAYRSGDVGFVFQFYHLLPELTVLENVVVGSMIRHGRLGYMRARAGVRERAGQILSAFGLGDRLRHRPAELSGGERQRVAIARALINQPRLLLADEPTGNLDRETGAAILGALVDQCRQMGLTMIMVTHDQGIAESADRIVHLFDGRVVERRHAEAEGESRAATA